MKLLIIFLFISQVYARDFIPRTFSLKFEQQLKSRVSGKLKKSFGTLVYKYPSQIRFEVEKPQESLFVGNSKKSWYYTPPFIEGEKGSVKVSDGEQLFLPKLFDSLRAGLKSTKLYTVKINKEDAEVIFKKDMQKKTGLKKVTLKGKKITSFNDVKKMVILKNNDTEVTLILSHFDKSPKISKKTFHFDIPTNAKILN